MNYNISIMKIKYISITNFKGIDSIEFNPKMVNILVGRNNTGKTSILQSIAITMNSNFINDIEEPSMLINYLGNEAIIKLKVEETNVQTHKVIIRKTSVEEIIKLIKDNLINYFDYIMKYKKLPIKLSAEIKNNMARENLIESLIKKINIDEVKRAAASCIALKRGKKLKYYYSNIYNKLNEKAIKFLISAIRENFNLKDNINDRLEYYWPRSDLLNTLKQLSTSRTENKVVYIQDPLNYIQGPLKYIQGPLNYLENNKNDKNQNLVLEIENILKNDNIIPNLLRFNFDSIVIKTSEGDKEIPVDFTGDGFKVLVSILGSIRYLDKNQIVLLEEPEVHLHPGYIKELVKYLIDFSRKSNIQLFISTHSQDLIENILSDDNISSEEQEFIKNELLILRLSKKDDTVISEEINFDDSVDSLKNLLLDLRGI